MDGDDRPAEDDESVDRDEPRADETEQGSEPEPQTDGTEGRVESGPTADAEPRVESGPTAEPEPAAESGSADDTEPEVDPEPIETDAPDEADDTATGPDRLTDRDQSTDRDQITDRDQSTISDRTGAADRSSLLDRFRSDREGALMWIREMLTSVAVVLLVGLLLFGVAGVWPPMVAVESGSMEPNMEVGDLVFVTEPGRLAPDAADNGIGVVTYDRGQETEYQTFGSYGSVVIYTPPDRTGSPIIHRAMFHVEEGENWYDRADDRYHDADDCESLSHCPAPHDGYITLGDNNEYYDQARGLSPPVKAEWVTGVARARVPYLGYIRLLATGQVELNEAIDRTLGSGLPLWQTTGLGLVGPGVSDSSVGPGVSDPGGQLGARAG